MGAEIVSTVVEGFTSGGTGLATGFVQFFDGITKTAEGTLTGVAEVGFTMIGFGLIIAVAFSVWRKLTRKV